MLAMELEILQVEGFALHRALREIQQADLRSDVALSAVLAETFSERKDYWLQNTPADQDLSQKLANAWFELEMAAVTAAMPDDSFPSDWENVYDELRYMIPQVQAGRFLESGLDQESALAMAALSPDESSKSMYNEEAMEVAWAIAQIAMREHAQTTFQPATSSLLLGSQSFGLVA